MRPPQARPRLAPPDSSLSILALASRICRLAAGIRTLDLASAVAELSQPVISAFDARSLAKPPKLWNSLATADGPSGLFVASSPEYRSRCCSLNRSSSKVIRSRTSQLLFSPPQMQRRFASTMSLQERPTTNSDVQSSLGSDLAGGETVSAMSPSEFPPHWHWVYPLDPDASSSVGAEVDIDLRKTVTVLARIYTAEAQAHLQDPVNFRERRRLDSDHLWQKYTEHAHRASLPISTRLFVANRLSSNIALTTANKEDRAVFKMLRLATGHRIAAIASDCETFLGSDLSKSSSVSVELGVANLIARVLALQCQPNQGLYFINGALKRLWPQVLDEHSLHRDRDLVDEDVDAVKLSLYLIVDSIIFDVKCRPSSRDIKKAISLYSEFFVDSVTRKNVFESIDLLSHSADGASTWLASLIRSSCISWVDPDSSDRVRKRLMQSIALIDNVADTLSAAVGIQSWKNPNVVRVSMLCLRAHLIFGSKDATLDLVELLGKHNMIIPDTLASRLIKTLCETHTGHRIERMVQTLLLPTNKIRSNILKRLPISLLKTTAAFWAERGHPEHTDAFLSEILRRDESEGSETQFWVKAKLAAALGETKNLKTVLSEKYDLEANVVEEVTSGKGRLNYQSASLLLQGFCSGDELEAAEDLFNQALAMHLPMKVYHFNLLIDMHVRRSNIDEAISIFEQMKNFDVKPDTLTYTHIIYGFGLRRDPEGASHAMRAMVSANVQPDLVAYSALLNSYVEAGLFASAVDLFKWMQNHSSPSYHPNIEVCNTILKAYVTDSLPIQDVLQFVATTRASGLEPNPRTFALMLQSACDAGMMNIAERLFEEAEKQLPSPPDHPPGQGADMYHFTIIIHGYLRLGDAKEAKSYWDEMERRGILPSDISWAVLISSYAQGHSEVNYKLATTLVSQLTGDEANSTYRQTPWRVPVLRPGLPFETIFAPLIVSHARRGEPEDAENTMNDLVSTKSGASLYSLTPLLDAYRRAGLVDKGMDLFDRIYNDALASARTKPYRLYAYSETPKSSTTSGAADPDSAVVRCEKRREDITSRNMLCLPMSIAIDMLANAGRHVDIAEIWSRAQRDGFGFDSDNWNHLATSMARAGQLDEAMSVVQHVLFHHPPSRRTYQALKEKKEMQKLQPTNLAETPHFATFDPLAMRSDIDEAKNHLADAVSSPSRPPNRRHEHRVDDDPYAPLPFDLPSKRPYADEEPVTSDDDIADSKSELSKPPQPSSYRIDSSVGETLTRSLTQGLFKLSPWYAHYVTMEAISRGLAKLQNRSQVIRLKVKYPTAAELLEAHEAKVESLELKQEERAAKSARKNIDGTPRT